MRKDIQQKEFYKNVKKLLTRYPVLCRIEL